MWGFIVLLSPEEAVEVIYEASVDEARILLGCSQISPADLVTFLPRVSLQEHKGVRGDYLVLGRHPEFDWAG